MGNLGAKAVGVEKPPVTLDESVNGIVKVVKEARKDTHNGIFWDFTGSTWKW
jgi:norsolorinic acid ketoreductase